MAGGGKRCHCSRPLRRLNGRGLGSPQSEVSGVEVLGGAVAALLRQLLIGLGPLFAVAALLYLCIRLTQRLLVRAFGYRFLVYWTGWLGTPIHELSHVIVGKLTGIDIVEFKLYSPDERTGVLGYVKYIKPKLELKQVHKVVGTFLMGIAPLFGGAAAISLAWLLLINPAADGHYYREVHELALLAGRGSAGDVVGGYAELMREVYAQVFTGRVDDWRTWVFCYVALAVGAHLAPSHADLEGGLVGFLVLCGIALAANVVAIATGIHPTDCAAQLAQIVSPLTALLVLTLGLNLGNLALAAVGAGIRRAM
jgi:hypothetical protein